MSSNGLQKTGVRAPGSPDRRPPPGKSGQASQKRDGSGFPEAEWGISIQGFLGIIAVGSLLLVLLVVRHATAGKSHVIPLSTAASASAGVISTRRPLSAMPSLRGEGVRVRGSDGRMTSIGTGTLPLTKDAEIELTDTKSQARLAYADGGTIILQGRGRLLISANGFSTSEGAFSATFKKGINPLEVHVPGATLDIRGTTIRFDLWLAAGTIQLIDGIVIVRPDAPEAKPVEWNAGDRLSVKKDHVEPLAPSESKMRSTVSPAENTPFASQVSITHARSGKPTITVPRTSGDDVIPLETALREHIPEPPPGREQTSH